MVGCYYYGEGKLLNGSVVNFCSLESIGVEKHQSLLCFPDISTTLTAISEFTMYNVKVFSFSSGCSVDSLPMIFFNLLKEISHAGVHVTYFCIVFSRSKNGRHLSMLFGRNLFNIVMLPFNRCTSLTVLGGFMSKTSLCFSLGGVLCLLA